MTLESFLLRKVESGAKVYPSAGMGEDEMSVAILLAGALAAQSADQLTVNAPAFDQVDVAYEELRAGRNLAALEELEASPLVQERDPSALINLGTAYARLGKTEKAKECYRAAMSSDDRYVVELADGTWIDSRRAAFKAADALSRSEILALR
jgi:tetratricopeptide (TPR) repeat protein